MATMLEARDALVAAVNAAVPIAYPTWPLFYDNAGIPAREDLVKFIQVEIKFIEGRQADMSNAPIHRRWGTLVFRIGAREYAGSRESIGLMDYLADTFQTKHIGSVLVKAGRPQPQPPPQSGWATRELWLPFEVDYR